MKKIVSGIFAFIAGIISFYSCTAQTSNTDVYKMFRGDAVHTGVYPSVAVATPHVKWKFKTGGYVHSSPAILGDRIYFGSADSNLYCLDIKTGNVVWKAKTAGEVNSSPAIVNGTVFFNCFDGNFYALNAENGKTVWTFTTGGEKRFSAKHLHGQEPADSLFVDKWDFWLSSPVTDGSKIYFGSGDGNLYALDIKTGKKLWSFQTDEIIHSSPALAYGKIYFGGWDTYMHALDANTGKEAWKFQTGIDEDKHNQTGITGSATVSDGMIYFGCRDSYVYALDAGTGKQAWKKFNDHGWISITPVVLGDKLIYSSGSSHSFAALNKKTGEELYRHEILSGTFASPSITGNTLYQGTFAGTMSALDVNTGEIKWTFYTDGALQDKYQLLNPDHTLNDDKIEAAVKREGGKLRPIDMGLSLGCITSSPVIKDGVMYFGSTDGNFYALD